MHEIRVHSLVGHCVRDVNGESIGRIEELRVQRRNDEAHVTEFYVGEYGALERFAGGALARSILRLIPRMHRGRRIAWELLDLTDPHHPKVRVAKDALPLAD